MTVAENTKYEVQVRYPNARNFVGREWTIARHAKPGDLVKDLVFQTVEDAKKERAAMTRRSAKYGWGAEYRIVKVVTTYEVIA